MIDGLGDVGSYSAPVTLFNLTGDGRWNLIAGESSGRFNGYYWDGSWNSDSSIVSGLGDVGSFSSPAVAPGLLENEWYLISGISNGRFYSYYLDGEWMIMCGDFVSIKASDDAASEACIAGANTTIYSVGFGPVSYCPLAKSTLQSVASCGNGTYYASSNATELKNIYRGIAEGIVNISYQAQTVSLEGAGINTLYPDSYIELNYTKESLPTEYQEISIGIDTEPLDGCNGSFFVPEELSKIESVRVTSFSGDLWTDNVSVKSSLTEGWSSVYQLSDYGRDYTQLGDPYVVQVPKDLVETNSTNYVNIILAAGPDNISSNCSTNNRVMYTARFRASVFYSEVFPDIWGSNVTVYFDRDHDGNQDGSINIEVGKDLQRFNSTLKTVDELDLDNNAMDDAFVRLLNHLNFVELPGNSGLAGTMNNPIDVELSEDMRIESLFIGGIPYMWGPVDIGIGVWV